jgi:ornithine cyclodeaminase/alanine dehydrogenase-like protein (mu-crystallin family)
MKEFDDRLVNRLDRIIVDDRNASAIEAGELKDLFKADKKYDDKRIMEVGDLLAQNVQKENTRTITLFKSVGISIQDIALASIVFENAKKAGLGCNYTI